MREIQTETSIDADLEKGNYINSDSVTPAQY